MSKLGGVTNEGTVVSNLPLLFADGLPTSLEKITLKQLEKFIVLMLNCSTSREYYCYDSLPIPKWWPMDVPFNIPLVKPDLVGDDWILKLKALVTRCYKYHSCEFMLTFSHDLAKYPVNILKFVDLCDGTTALLNKENGKLLVTFRNQNVIYDRKVENNSRKYLLPRGGKGSSDMLLHPPPFIDIYLCDSCDAEFETLNEVSEHERLCRREQQDHQPVTLRSSTPDDLLGLGDDQSKFLNYFNLGGCLDGECSPFLASPPRPKPFKRRCQGNVSFIRCSSIPFSSPLGISLQKKMPRATYVVPQAHLDRVERYCLPVKQSPRIFWSHLYRNAKKKSSDWAHTYSFNKRQRLAKYESLEIGLSERSIRLLKICLELEVSLTRLSEEDIVELTKRNATKSVSTTKPSSASLQEVQPIVSLTEVDIPVIDLCSSDDEDSGISSFINSPSPKIARVSVLENSRKTEDSCSFQLNYFQSVMITNPLPINYSSSSFTTSKLVKPIILRKRWRRSRKSLASENEIIPTTRERKKISKNNFPVHNEAKSKLQELNQIKESNDTTSKEWYPQFISSNQANHDGKKYSTAV